LWGHSRRFSDVFRYFIAKGVQRGDNLRSAPGQSVHG
jgi:hypothetical protein